MGRSRTFLHSIVGCLKLKGYYQDNIVLLVYFVKTTRFVIPPQLKEAASSLKFGDYTERTLNLKSAIFPQSEKI